MKRNGLCNKKKQNQRHHSLKSKHFCLSCRHIIKLKSYVTKRWIQICPMISISMYCNTFYRFYTDVEIALLSICVYFNFKTCLNDSINISRHFLQQKFCKIFEQKKKTLHEKLSEHVLLKGLYPFFNFAIFSLVIPLQKIFILGTFICSKLFLKIVPDGK